MMREIVPNRLTSYFQKEKVMLAELFVLGGLA